MKFQNRSIHGSKVNRRTDRQTDRQTDKPKAICPSNFFKVGGIKNDHVIFLQPKFIKSAAKILKIGSVLINYVKKKNILNIRHFACAREVTQTS